MSIDERQRHGLYERLDDVLGAEHADTLMSHCPTGWAEVATKSDLRALGAEIRAEVADLRTELHQSLRQQLWAIVGSLLLAVLIAQFVGLIG